MKNGISNVVIPYRREPWITQTASILFSLLCRLATEDDECSGYDRLIYFTFLKQFEEIAEFLLPRWGSLIQNCAPRGTGKAFSREFQNI